MGQYLSTRSSPAACEPVLLVLARVFAASYLWTTTGSLHVKAAVRDSALPDSSRASLTEASVVMMTSLNVT